MRNLLAIIASLVLVCSASAQPQPPPPYNIVGQWPAAQYFEAGVPYCSLGPSPGPTVDSAPLLAACNATLNALGGGEIRPESGQAYCFKSNTTLGANVGMRAPGTSYSNSSTHFSSTTPDCASPTDTTIVTLGTGGFSYGVSYFCYGFGATQPCVNAVGNRITFQGNRVVGGTIPLSVPNVDGHFTDNRINGGLGAESILVNSGYFYRNNLNQNYGGGCIPAAGSITSISAWAPTTGYTTCNIVSLSGMYLQAAGNFTSGGSLTIPANTAISALVPDNGGNWTLLAPSTYYAFVCTAGCIERDSDHTGPFTAGSAVLVPSASLAVSGNNYGQNFTAGIYATNGSVNVAGLQTSFSNCVTTTCAGVLTTGSATASHFSNLFIHGQPYGVEILSGTDNSVEDSIMFGLTQDAVIVGGGTNATTVALNHVGAPFGQANAHTIVLQASSDDNVVIGNVCVGATTPGLVNNSGGGANYIPSGGNPGC